MHSNSDHAGRLFILEHDEGKKETGDYILLLEETNKWFFVMCKRKKFLSFQAIKPDIPVTDAS